MSKQDKQFILMSVLKYGTPWNAYIYYRDEADHNSQAIGIFREYLNMEDESID